MKVSFQKKILKKLNENELIVTIVGLGYVGLPLALLFGKKLNTFGLDTSQVKIHNLKLKIDTNKQCEKQNFVKSKFINFTFNYEVVKKSDVIIICLPTPINKSKKPDLKILKKATKEIAQNMNKNAIIIYESTVYPGLIEEVCVPILENKSNLIWKKNFYLGYSPERVNPNDKLHTIEKIDKIVSADSPELLSIIYKLYKKILKNKIIKCQSIKVAEAAKVLENTQRDINIALMNELSIICHKLKIDTKEVIDAASTKWNFIRFDPGLVGGHCIGVDPYYLKEKSIKLGYFPKIISSGRKINDGMVEFIFQKISSKIKKKSKSLFIGVTFKENCNDIRNSKNLELIKYFIKSGFDIDIYDPIFDIKNDHYIDKKKIITNLNDLSQSYKNIILLVPHKFILEKKKIIINKISKGGYFFDIKSRIEKDLFTKKKINYWRL